MNWGHFPQHFTGECICLPTAKSPSIFNIFLFYMVKIHITVFTAALCVVMGRPLYFTPVVSIFLLFVFFSPISLSGRRLVVHHTSTNDVALVRIQNVHVGVKSAASGSLKIQDAKNCKNSSSAHHRTNLPGYIFTSKVCVDNWEKFIKQQYFLHMSSEW